MAIAPLDPTGLPEFVAWWDSDIGVDNQAGDAISWTSAEEALSPIVWESDYVCAAPEIEAPNPNCDYGEGFPAAVAAGGLRHTHDAGYIVRYVAANASYFPNLQLGFTAFVVATVHDVDHALPSSPTVLNQNHKCEILLGDNRGSAGTCFGLDTGQPYFAGFMNHDDFSPRGVHLGPITLGERTLMVWHYTGSGGTATWRWGGLEGSDTDIVGYRTADSRPTFGAVIYNKLLCVNPPCEAEPRAIDATVDQILLLSPEVDRATWLRVGTWLLAQ